jgi:hypothetical protein
MSQQTLAHVAVLGFFFFLLQVPQPARPNGQVTILTILSKRYSSVHSREKAAQKWNGVAILSGTITVDPLYGSDLHYAARRPGPQPSGGMPDPRRTLLTPRGSQIPLKLSNATLWWKGTRDRRGWRLRRGGC